VFARRPDTGEAVWFYQFSPHDLHDYDGVNENVLVDLPTGRAAAQGAAAPRPQRLRVRDGPHHRPGAVGHAVRARHHQHRRRPGDRRAALQPAQGAAPRRDRAQHLPGVAGRQGLAAVGLVAAHAAALHPAPEPVPGRAQLAGQLHRGHALRGRRREDVPGPGGNRGVFTAWDPVNQRKVWDIKENFPVWSGALVTAGDVAFYGTMDGWFKAVDAAPASCCGSSRPSPGSSASRSPTAAPTASSTSPCSPASAAGPARSCRAARPARRHRGAGLRQRDARPVAGHARRAACSTCSALGGAAK
jgi:hypothetical protein